MEGYHHANATLSFPKAPIAKKNIGRVFYPIGYGADPTGARESSDAIKKALYDAFQVQNGLELLPDVHDLGGVVIDLQGGNYKISKPIRFPSGGGNIVVKRGTLRASETFPGDRHLIELCYRGGGIFTLNSVRTRINNCFFIHFTTQGILVREGHETLISSSFLGQHPTVGGDKNEKKFSGTAIDLESNDNSITDVVVFSAAIGVLLRGEANILTGVHCYNKANVFGGVGIIVKPTAFLTRINNCYLDFTNIVMEDPIQVQVTNGLFIGDAYIVLQSINGKISGLNIVDNMFKGEGRNLNPIVELDGNFTRIDQVVIERNNVRRMSLKSTVGKLTVAGNGTKWVADFSSVLIFPNKISNFQYSFYVRGVPTENMVHAVTDVSKNMVVVESNKVVNAVVSVEVDQSSMVEEINHL
ncbi:POLYGALACTURONASE QRT3 [Salix purpurea]|uniref:POLYGALACTURONASE QRT3 n=1 Tax=Salix purpurea TaxID=77065 RepID=A0A9Q0QGC7_SALPP|nr:POLYGALACTURONASE QRT3 [Salix purpurea]